MANKLDGITSVFHTSLNNEIQDNLIEFFDWGLLERGNYFNVTLNETQDGIDYSLLKLSEDTNFEQGTVWEGFRKNWIWQSGVNYYPPPIVGTSNAYPGLSGIYINDNFYPTDTTGQYSYYIDYYNGKIIFNNPIPTDSKIQAEYSYRYINVIYANSLPWIREIQYNSLFLDSDKPTAKIPVEASVQLPAIAIEVVPKRTMKGLQLGGGQFINTDVLFHCIAEDEYTRNNLIDIVSFQNDKVIYLFNSNALSNNKKLPIDYRGVPVSGALRYPDIISKYKFGKLRFKDVLVQNMSLINTNLYAGIVRMTTETVETFSLNYKYCEDIECVSGNNQFYLDATHFNYGITGGSWISTNIIFNSGDIINVAATGCVNCDKTTGTYCKTGPDGMNTGEGATYTEPDGSQTFYDYNALIGRINQNNTIFSKSFKIGSEYNSTCPMSGILELAIYDTDSTDNLGGYCVYVEPPYTSDCESFCNTNLVQNGDFELDSQAESSVPTHWSGANVDICGSGNIWIDLNSCSRGYIQQSFATTIGAEYTVYFNLAANNGCTPSNPCNGRSDNTINIKILKLSVADKSKIFSFNMLGTNNLNPNYTGDLYYGMGWKPQSLSFTAINTTTTLKFESLSDSCFGPAIDCVQVCENVS